MKDPQLEEQLLAYALQERYLTELIRVTDEHGFPAHNEFWKYIRFYYNKYHKVPSKQVVEDTASRLPKAVPIYTLYSKLSGVLAHDKDWTYFFEKYKEYDCSQRLLNIYSGTLEHLKNNKGYAALKELKKVVLYGIQVIQDDTVRQVNLTNAASKRLENYKQMKDQPDLDAIPSGFELIDRPLRGFHRGELIMVIAPTSGGKSTFLLNLAKNAYNAGKNVMYVTLEMPAADIADRFDSMVTGIPYGKFVSKSLTDEDEKVWADKLKEQEKRTNVFEVVDIPRGCTSAFLESKIASNLKDIDILIVDYIGEMTADKSGRSDWEEQGGIALEMKQLARAYDIPVVTAAQTTREGAQKGMFELTHISRAWGIAQRSDICLGLVAINDGEMQVNVLKARKMGKFGFKIRLDFSRMIMEDLDKIPMELNTNAQSQGSDNSMWNRNETGGIGPI